MKIVLEGNDCSGKTAIVEKLKATSLDIIFHAEPTEIIKQQILNKACVHDDLSDILLFAASRKIVQNNIEALETIGWKNHVLDRSLLSSIVYQEDTKKVIELNNFYKKADLIILLDIDESARKERLTKRGNADRLEKNREISEKYKKMLKKHKNILCNEYRIIDTSSKTELEVFDEVFEIIKNKIDN